MLLKILVQESLKGYLEKLEALRDEMPLDITTHSGDELPDPGLHHLLFLEEDASTRDLAAGFKGRVYAVGPGEGIGVLPPAVTLGTLEAIVSGADEHAGLNEELTELRAIVADLGRLARISGLAEKLHLVAMRTAFLTDSCAASVLLIDEESGEFRREAIYGTPEGVYPPPPPAIDQGLLGELALGQKRAVLTREIQDDPYLSSFPLEDGRPPGCALVVPIINQEQTLGIIHLFRPEGSPLYNDRDVAVAGLVATNAAIAIQNLRLYDQARRAHDELLSTQRQFIQVEKLTSLGQLSAGIAHEINNPLFVIMGHLEMGMDRCEGTVRNHMKKALESAERIKRIVLDLRQFYQPAKNVFGPISVNRIVENAIPIVRLQVKDRPLQFKLDLAEDLPLIHGDDNQILQVFINLLLNAAQAQPEGGDVRVRTSHEDSEVVARVSDDGVGIPPENLNRVYDPFFTTKREWTGTGLGLAVTHTIIQKHSGVIDIQSSLGQGTTVVIRFPAYVDEDLAGAGEGPPVPAPVVTRTSAAPPAGDVRRIRMLVVDDEPFIQEYMADLLEDEADVDTADGGREALKLIEANDYDVVFLDKVMPEMGGEETLRKIREQKPDLPVVLLTGAINGRMDDYLVQGFRFVLSKPCQSSEIRAVLEAVKKQGDA